MREMHSCHEGMPKVNSESMQDEHVAMVSMHLPHQAIEPTSTSDIVTVACLQSAQSKGAMQMSEIAPAARTRRVTSVALVAFLSLNAVTSANASPPSFQSFHASPAVRSYYSPSFRAPPQARSYYSPSTSMIAPPMQQAPPIAPLSPHVSSGF
jgi:hypothetical protein